MSSLYLERNEIRTNFINFIFEKTEVNKIKHEGTL